MQFNERDEGDYRIYAGALESQLGDGYIAALIVNRISGGAPREVYRDVSLAGGHRWQSPDAALRYAMAKGCDVLRSEPHRLAC